MGREKESYWTGAIIAVVVIYGCGLAFALAYAISSFNNSQSAVSQQTYYQDTTLAVAPNQHALRGSTPMTITLPNDLTSYIGRSIRIDCVNSGGHTIRIASGALATRWKAPALRVATCTSAGDGITFVVTSAYTLRIENDTPGMVYS